jgi:hypothetical protein
MTYVYIKKDELNYFEVEQELNPEVWQIGSTLEDYNSGLRVLLSDEQVVFHETHPGASKKEVIEMKLTVPPERTLADAIREKITAIDVYDTSDAVNGFFFNGTGTRIPVEQRSYLKGAIEASKVRGVSTIEVPLLGEFFTLPVATVESLLSEVEVYAYNASIRTAKHKAAVNDLSVIEEVDAYDFTTGYPEKVIITLPQ